MSYTYGFTAGIATFGLALPKSDGAVNVQVGDLQTQFDGKNVWDGTKFIRFGVCTTKVPTAGIYPIRFIDAPTTPAPAFSAEWPSASVTYTVAGIPYTAILPAHTSTSDTWLNGPLVNEARAVVAPLSGGAPHPLLQTVFDVRSYVGGGYRVDICGQNTRDIAAADQVVYDLAITVNGRVVYSKLGCVHQFGKRWRKTFTVNLPLSDITPDFESFFGAGRFPRVLTSVVNPTYSTAGPTWDILQTGALFGDMNSNMPEVGGRPTIGPYPAWALQYLVHKTQNLRQHMLLNGDMAGSWSGHVAEPDGVSIVRLDKAEPKGRGTYWFDSRWHDSGGDGPKADGRGTGSRIDTTHLYSLSAIPYAVTGDRFYLDTLKFWANQVLLQTYPGAALSPLPGLHIDFGRQAAKGLLMPYANEPRGFGWGLREITDAAEACPDADPDKAYFTERVQNNLTATDNYARTQDGGMLPATFHEDTPPSQDANHGIMSTWQIYYLCWAHDNARRKGFAPTKAFRDRINLAVIKFLTQMNPVAGMALYYPYVGDIVNGVFTLYPDMATFAAKQKPSSGYVIGYYGSDARMCLLQAVRDGLPDAQKALDVLNAYRGSDGATIIDDINSMNRSQYAIAMDGAIQPEPTPSPIPAPVPVPIPPVPPPNPTSRTLVLAATATQDQPNVDPSTLSYKVTVAVKDIPHAALPQTRISFSEVKDVTAGQTVPVQAIAYNAGKGDATNVKVTPAIQGATITGTDDAAFDVASGLWTVGSLASLEQKQIGLTVKVQP